MSKSCYDHKNKKAIVEAWVENATSGFEVSKKTRKDYSDLCYSQMGLVSSAFTKEELK